MKIETVLFDLDGTLLDTAPDLHAAMITLQAKHDKPPIPLEKLRSEVGYGGAAMLKAAFGIDENHPKYTELLTDFFKAYEDQVKNLTDFFPGMPIVLDDLETRGITWGIVTNKPSRFTYDLLAEMNLKDRAACIICGDSLSRRKPHPDQIQHALQLLNMPVETCLYVGDTLVDVKASRAAGTYSLIALYGYIRPDETPKDWGADAYIDKPLEIIDYLESTQS